MDLKIKVCGMREFTNIGDVSDLKPDMMGFIFYPKSKRYVGDDYDPNLIHSIKPIIQTVGVFVNEWTESLTDKLIRYRFDVVQLHGNESPAYCREIHKKCNVLKAFGIHDNFDWTILEPYMNACDYFLFDTNTKGYGGSGIKFNWKSLGNYHLSKPFFLSGGIGMDDVDDIKSLQIPNLAGIDINSKFETEPGLKNIPLLDSFFQKIRQD